jgi:hypothetical protein
VAIHILQLLTTRTSWYTVRLNQNCHKFYVNIWLLFIKLITLKSSVFWDITLCNPLKVNRYFKRTYGLHLQGWRVSQERNYYETGSKQRLLTSCFMIVSCVAYSSIMKTEVTYSSERSVDSPQTTWHYVPENRTFHNHYCGNLKFYH